MITFKPADWRLYVIADPKLHSERTHLEIARAAIAGGADVIQLRDKTSPTSHLLEVAFEIRKITKSKGIPFIINDRLDIALAVDADGLHVGQKDLPASDMRYRLGKSKILGVSVLSPSQAVAAVNDGADYLGVGPVFEARGTKPDAGEPQGLELIRIVRQQCDLPIVAIGGINNDNAVQVIQAGADAVAVISAVAAAPDMQAAAKSLRELVIQAHEK